MKSLKLIGVISLATMLPLTLHAGEQDVVLHARGALEFEVPQGWQVAEVPRGREIRLIVSPYELPAAGKELRAGAWLAYHRVSRDVSPEAAFQHWTNLRISQLPQGTSPRQDSTRQFGSWPATSFRYQTTANEYATHLIVRTTWGVLEFHTQGPANLHQSVSAELLPSIRLKPPKPQHSLVASEIVGTWKALQGKLEVSENGRLSLRFDDQGVYPIDQQGTLRFGQRVDVLSGSYVLKDDLLLIRWDDGSLLNWRWRVQHDSLLVTDHLGRVNELRRLW